MSARSLGPIARSVSLAAGVGLVVAAVSALLPLSDDASHAALHLNGALPGAVLLGHALATWPSTGRARAAIVSRAGLLIGIAVFTVGQLIEAVGAFGRWDRPGLNRAHDVGVLIGPIGVIVVLTGAITSGATLLAARRGHENSRYLTAAVVLSIVAAAAFIGGALVFGY